MTHAYASGPGRRRTNFGLSRFFLALSLLLLVLAGCTPQSRQPGYVHFRLTTNPTTLDPALIVDVQGGLIAAKLFNGLVRLDEKLRVVSDIAERWEIRDRGLKYVFHLRRGVRFSNGREVTADDFSYSFMRILDPSGRSPNTWVLDKIRGAKDFLQGRSAIVPGIRSVGRYTLEIDLERPFSPFLQLLTMTAAYVVPREEVEKWGQDYSSHPIGSGPFVLREWSHNTRLVLARNDGYFADRALAAGIVFRIIPEDLTAVSEFELGNLDVLGVPAAEYARFRRSSRWRPYLSSMTGLNTYYVGFNCSRSPFDNPRLRQAVFHSVDREKILGTFFEGRGRLASGPVPDPIRAWDAPTPYAFDPEAARGIIRTERADGMRVNFLVPADQEVVDIAEIIQSYLESAGLKVAIRQLEWSAYKQALNRGEADLFWIGWWADYPNPENFLFPLFHSSNHGASGNRTRYANHEVDRLIEAGQLATDSMQANAFYGQAERIIAREAPWVYFWHKTDFTVRQPWLKQYRLYPVYSMDKGTEVSL